VAWKDEPEILAILSGTEMRPLTPRTITTSAEFLRETKSVRSAGCALNRGESEDDVRCVSAPIRDSTGQVVAGLSVSSPKERYHAAREKQLIGLVLEACRQISLDLGCDRGPEQRKSPRRPPPRKDLSPSPPRT
jgi:IclR family KDG regulon transcriptional repressor